MTSSDKAFAILIVALMVGLAISSGFESWAEVERARHGCVEKKK